MKITHIEVHAETRFNDKHEQFRNHCPSVTLKAEVAEGEDARAALTRLQCYAAEGLAIERTRILDSRKAEVDAAERNTVVERLKERIAEHRENIEEERKLVAEIEAMPPPDDDDVKSQREEAKDDNLASIEQHEETLAALEKRLAEIEAGGKFASHEGW